MRRLTFILLALTLCVSAFGQAFTPRRPFITASSGAWTPLNLPSIQYWWVATDIASNSIVTNWIDRIASFPASQDVDSRRPTNGLNGVCFSGSTYLTNNPYDVNWCGLSNVSGIVGTIFTIFRPSANLDYAGIVTGGQAGNDGYGFSCMAPPTFLYSGGHFAGGHNYCLYATNSMYDVGITFGPAISDDNCMITNGVYAATNADGFLGRFEEFGRQAVGNTYIGYITEIMSFTTRLTDAEFTLLHNYATNTYWAQYQNYALPISITVHPVSVSCLTNYITSFSITQSGASSFQWRTNSVNVANGNRWAGANASTLWVTNDSILLTNLAIDCVLTNLLYAQTSAVAYLTVMDNAVTNGLVGWWRMDEGTGTSTADSSGFGHGGYLTNSPGWATGKYTNGIYAPYSATTGAAAFVRVTNAADLNSFSALTLAGWAYKTNTGVGGIICKKTTTDGSGAPPYCLYELSVASGTTMFAGVSTGSGSRKEVTCAVGGSTQNAWHHYTATFDGTFLNVYFDGLLLTNYNAGAFSIGSNAFPLNLGGNLYGAGAAVQTLGGIMDDVRIYNRAISTNEINALVWWTGPQQ